MTDQPSAPKQPLTFRLIAGVIGAASLVGGMALSVSGAMIWAVSSLLEAEGAALWAIVAGFLAPSLYATGKVTRLAYQAELEYPD